MTKELFVFVKTFQERLDDFTYILNNNSKTSEIKREWSTFIEFTMEPTGWRAIWKISRDLCTDLKIDYPCTVVVTVQHINFKELSSTVTINEVDDDKVCLPPMMADIPLVELYPTIEQDNNFMLSKLMETAKTIDSLRLFYNHLWMPWDEDYDEENSWVASHLEGRLNLHFAMLERKVSNDVAFTVRHIVTEGRKIRKEIEDLEEQLSEEMEVEGFPTRLLELTELHNQMSILRNKYIIFQKPDLLKAFIQRAQRIEKAENETENNCETISLLVLQTCTPEQLRRVANATSVFKLLRVFQTLQETLMKAPANALVNLLQGKHPVHDMGNFEVGGTIRGMEPGVVMTEEVESPLGWSLLSGTLTLANLTVQMSSVWNIIKVRPGAECSLQNIRLEGASVTDGVDVFPHAKLVANNCHFSNCRTAVVGDTNSIVVLTNCTFDSNGIAIEVKEGCCLTMENCTISGSKRHGVKIITGNGNKHAVDGLNSIPGLKESETIFRNNEQDYHMDCSPDKLADNVNSGDLSTSR